MNNGSIRYGTSSFSEKDWVGVFYPQGTQPRDYLKYYATQFDTVEVDATYYAVPAKSTVQKWFNETPENFLLSAKFPRSIVHCGEKATPDSSKILLPEYTYQERDWFLNSISEMGERLGMLILQFPYFSKKVFERPDEFYERLDRFLEELPDGFDYGVEIRNKWWVKPKFVDILRKHDVSFVLVDQAWMPHGDEIEEKYDLAMGKYIYIRLLGD
ncbi:DUF72 domain-containing protein, partial [bacterium]|nr:DUF72 domain-containing protein [bacterium]